MALTITHKYIIIELSNLLLSDPARYYRVPVRHYLERGNPGEGFKAFTLTIMFKGQNISKLDLLDPCFRRDDGKVGVGDYGVGVGDLLGGSLVLSLYKATFVGNSKVLAI